MYRRTALSALLATIASGCAITHLNPDEITAAALGANQGLLVGSFSRDPSGPKFFSQTFRFKNTVTGALHEVKAQPRFNLFSGKTPDDFSTDKSAGGVFAMVLPAGRYTFYNFRLYDSNGVLHKNWTSREDFSIPFEVHSNRVNYVGEIKLVPFSGKTPLFGIAIPVGGVWVISDQRARDLPLLHSRYPDVPPQQVQGVIPMHKERFTPLVVLPSEVEQHRMLSAMR